MSENGRKQREAIIAKVRALLAKTIENGATEAEALFAAAKAAELMAKYDLEMDEVEAREAGVKQADRDMDPVFAHHLARVCWAIADLCGVRTWGDGGGALLSKQTFFGLPHDVEVAGYLADVCERAMANDLASASAAGGWALFPRKRAVLSDSFLAGMSRRLSERISELAWTRKRATGSALVPLKDAIIEREMEDKGIELEDSRVGKRDVDREAFRQGRAAGEKVGLNAAVGGGPAPHAHLGDRPEDEGDGGEGNEAA